MPLYINQVLLLLRKRRIEFSNGRFLERHLRLQFHKLFPQRVNLLRHFSIHAFPLHLAHRKRYYTGPTHLERHPLAKRKPSGTKLVYSTDQGRLCPQCHRAITECACGKDRPNYAGDGIVRIRRETKGRGGKAVSVISGVPVDGAALKSLAKELKKRCGVGGSVKDGAIEIQGDHRDLLKTELEKRGYTCKLAGG